MIDVGTEILLYSGRYEVGKESRNRTASSSVFAQSTVGGPVAATITQCKDGEYEVRTQGKHAVTLRRVKAGDIMRVLPKEERQCT